MIFRSLTPPNQIRKGFIRRRAPFKFTDRFKATLLCAARDHSDIFHLQIPNKFKFRYISWIINLFYKIKELILYGSVMHLDICDNISEPNIINHIFQQSVSRLIIALLFTMRLINHNCVRVMYDIICFSVPFKLNFSMVMHTFFKLADCMKTIFLCITG